MAPEINIYFHPLLVYRLKKIQSKIFKKIAPLECYFIKDKEPIPYERVKKNLEQQNIKINQKSDSNENFENPKFIRLLNGKTWGKAYDCAIFNLKGKIQEKFIFSENLNKNLYFIFKFDGEGLYLNESFEPIFATNSKLSIMDYLQMSWNFRYKKLSQYEINKGFIDCYIDAGFSGKFIQPFGKAKFYDAYIALCNEKLKNYYYDYLYLCYIYSTLKDKNNKRILIKILTESYRKLGNFSDENVKNAHNYLMKAFSINFGVENFEVSAIGQAHLDMAWLWPIRETKRKSLRTFINSINLIEKYTEYIFGASQAQQFEWLKENHPKIFEKVKNYVKSGNIEIQGGMWVESDCNLPSGESLIRQIIYGKKFFKKEFDIDVKTCWLPDAFGFPASLPQILKKSEIDYFCTTKLSWNTYNKFPYDTFNWKGIDGTTILSHFPPEGTYTSEATPCSIKFAADNFKQKSISNKFLLVYGNGDGGGGPNESHIELLNREKKYQNIAYISFEKAIDFFEKINKDKEKFPTFEGELYLEKHQGTYTTQALNKLYNRKIEILLHNVEALATFAYLKGYKYPKQNLDKIWKEVLLYQFHDILPGSSVKRVYDETSVRYSFLIEELEKIKDEILKFLAVDNQTNFAEFNNLNNFNDIDKFNDSKNFNENLYAINLTSFSRKEFIKYKDRWYFCEIQPYSSKKLIPFEQNSDFSYSDSHIENDKIKLVFSKAGEIISFFDKINKNELCKDYLNRLILFKDKWLFYNAWDIDINYRKKPKKILKAKKSITFIDGPKIIRRNFYYHKKTKIIQDVILTANSSLVEFSTEVDFHENFKMLRAEFNPSFYSDDISCEIQFGFIKRRTTEKNSLEKAAFEICAHKWVDISSEGYGLTLINDCKYGHYAKNGIISLNLLRSPVYPDPSADRKKHTFRYALYPHSENLTQSDSIKQAFIFNNPLIITQNFTYLNPFCMVDSESVVIDTIKKAEEKDGIILRLYESKGMNISTSLKVDFGFNKCYETNICENIIKQVDINNLNFSPFEIKTLYFEI